MTVDRLSGGRLVLGVGLGDAWSKDFGVVGELTDPRRRAAVLDESLEVLTGLWTGQPVTYHCDFVSVDHVRLPATPVQVPRIPIWVGGCARFAGLNMCRPRHRSRMPAG